MKSAKKRANPLSLVGDWDSTKHTDAENFRYLSKLIKKIELDMQEKR